MKAHVPNAWPQTDTNGESEYDAGHNCIAMERYALSAECEPMMLVSVAYLHRALLVGKSEPCSPANLQYGEHSAKAAAKGQGQYLKLSKCDCFFRFVVRAQNCTTPAQVQVNRALEFLEASTEQNEMVLTTLDGAAIKPSKPPHHLAKAHINR